MPTEQSLQGEEEQKSIIIQLRELLDLELAATININVLFNILMVRLSLF